MAKPPEMIQDDANEDDWLVTYADAITLLMAFFVIMFSVSEPNTEKFERVSKGVVETLSRNNVKAPLSPNSGKQAQVDMTTQSRTVQFQSGKMFAPGSAKILPKAYPQLDRLSQNLVLLGNTRYSVTVEGHTDDVPINTAKFPSNWELSAARASAVVRYFLSRGVTPDRLKVVGRADTVSPRTAPLYNKSTGESIPENREANRRVVVKIKR
jgi:chemotaxis protein MotB